MQLTRLVLGLGLFTKQSAVSAQALSSKVSFKVQKPSRVVAKVSP
jgi:hypothetical protein